MIGASLTAENYIKRLLKVRRNLLTQGVNFFHLLIITIIAISVLHIFQLEALALPSKQAISNVISSDQKVARVYSEAWSLVLQDAERLVKIIALFVGATWTYIKFIRGRLYATRLEIDVSTSSKELSGTTYFIVGIKIKNIGASKALIEKEGTALRLFTPNNSTNTCEIDWDRLVTLGIFASDLFIEAGESIEESHLIKGVPDIIAFKSQVRVVLKKQLWGNAKNEWNTIKIHVIDAPIQI
jgi:hypothetical protein